jgi:hypothetical protein
MLLMHDGVTGVAFEAGPSRLRTYHGCYSYNKIHNKIPAGQVNYVHTRIWSARVPAAHANARDQ